MVSVPWLLPDLQKIINDYLTGHDIYNKVVAEYKSKINGQECFCRDQDVVSFGTYDEVWILANYRDLNNINTNRNILNFGCMLKNVSIFEWQPEIVGDLPVNY